MATDAFDLDRELAAFGPDAERRLATVEIAKRLAARLGAEDDGSDEVPAARQLREARDDPHADGLAMYSPMPEALAVELSRAALEVAAATPSRRLFLEQAIAEHRAKPKMLLGPELDPYLGISLVLFIAKFGFEDGKFVITPLSGEHIVDLFKSVASIVTGSSR